MAAQALNPDERALSFIRRYTPRTYKFIWVNMGDFDRWLEEIPSSVQVIGRIYGVDGWVDRLPWTKEAAGVLATAIGKYHDYHQRKVWAWECVNEPVVKTVGEMQQLAAFEAEWARKVKLLGIRSIVGNFSNGCPEPDLMPYFRPAIEEADYVGFHGYGPAGVLLKDADWLVLRYKMLMQAAGVKKPVYLTEVGIGGGYKSHGVSDEDYVRQLVELDKILQQDPLVEGAHIFCHGTYGGWSQYDLTDNAAHLLGEYIKQEGDVDLPDPLPPPPGLDEAKVKKAILGRFSQYWPSDWVRWGTRAIIPGVLLPKFRPQFFNPDFALAAEAVRQQFGLPPLTDEHNIVVAGYDIVFQFYPRGVVWAVRGIWGKVYSFRYFAV